MKQELIFSFLYELVPVMLSSEDSIRDPNQQEGVTFNEGYHSYIFHILKKESINHDKSLRMYFAVVVNIALNNHTNSANITEGVWGEIQLPEYKSS